MYKSEKNRRIVYNLLDELLSFSNIFRTRVGRTLLYAYIIYVYWIG